jgi:hypothetical protein
MGLDQLKALFDRSMQPGGDTQFDPYALLSAIRSKTEAIKMAKAQQDMAAMQQNAQAQGIGSLAQQVRREADMVQPPVAQLAQGGIVAFKDGERVVDPAVQARRDEIAAKIRAQEYKTPEIARDNLRQLDAEIRNSQGDRRAILMTERRLAARALNILESGGLANLARRGAEAVIPSANAAPVTTPATNAAPAAAAPDGARIKQLSDELQSLRQQLAAANRSGDPNSVNLYVGKVRAAEAALSSAQRASQAQRPVEVSTSPVSDLPNEALGRQERLLTDAIPAAPRTPGEALPDAATLIPPTGLPQLREAASQARIAAERARENLARFSGIAGEDLKRRKPQDYQAAVAAVERADRALQIARDAMNAVEPVQTTEMFAGAGQPTRAPSNVAGFGMDTGIANAATQAVATPAVVPTTAAAGPATAAGPTATSPAAAATSPAAASTTAAAAGPAAGPATQARPQKSAIETLIDQIAARETSRGTELQNRLSALRTRQGVPEEILSGQAGIERLMAEQIANEQRMRDERMAEARRMYEARQGELKPDIARILRSISSKPGELFTSLGDETTREEQRVRTGKEEARKELTAAQRESEEAGRNILKMRVLEAQRVQAIREKRYDDANRIEDQIAELRDKIAGQDIDALKAQADIRLRQAQIDKPSDLQEKINLAAQNPALFNRLFPTPDQRTSALDAIRTMSTNLIKLAGETVDLTQKGEYLRQLSEMNKLLAGLAGITPPKEIRRAVHNETGQQIISEDGGNTWKDANTGNPVVVKK